MVQGPESGTQRHYCSAVGCSPHPSGPSPRARLILHVRPRSQGNLRTKGAFSVPVILDSLGLLWTVVLTWPMMVAVQSVSARIGGNPARHRRRPLTARSDQGAGLERGDQRRDGRADPGGHDDPGVEAPANGQVRCQSGPAHFGCTRPVARQTSALSNRGRPALQEAVQSFAVTGWPSCHSNRSRRVKVRMP
jgi:hypothetical protein